MSATPWLDAIQGPDLQADPKALGQLPGFGQWDAHQSDLEADLYRRGHPRRKPGELPKADLSGGGPWLDAVLEADPYIPPKDTLDALHEIVGDPARLIDIFGATDAIQTWEIKDAGEALQTDEPLTKRQSYVLWRLNADRKRGSGRGANVLNTVAAMPAWGLGLFTGGAIEKGVGKGARALIGKAIEEAAVEATERAAAGGVLELVKRGAIATGKTTADILARQAIMEGAAAGQDLLMGVDPKGGRIASKAWQMAMPDLVETETDAGQMALALKGGVRDFVDVLGPATVSSLIETGTELYGGEIMKLPLLNRIEALEGGFVRWVSKKTGLKGSALLAKLAKEGGFSGKFAGEYAEEVEADILHSITPGDPDYGKGVPTLTDPETIATTLLSFAGAGLAFGGAHVVAGKLAGGAQEVAPAGEGTVPGTVPSQPLAAVGPTPMPPTFAEAPVQPAEPASAPAAESVAPVEPAKPEPNLPPAETWTPAQVAKEMGLGDALAEGVAKTHNDQLAQEEPKPAVPDRTAEANGEGALPGSSDPLLPEDKKWSAGKVQRVRGIGYTAAKKIADAHNAALAATIEAPPGESAAPARVNEPAPVLTGSEAATGAPTKPPTEAEYDAKLEELNRARLERPKTEAEAKAQAAKVDALDKELEGIEAAAPGTAAAAQEPSDLEGIQELADLPTVAPTQEEHDQAREAVTKAQRELEDAQKKRRRVRTSESRDKAYLAVTRAEAKVDELQKVVEALRYRDEAARAAKSERELPGDELERILAVMRQPIPHKTQIPGHVYGQMQARSERAAARLGELVDEELARHDVKDVPSGEAISAVWGRYGTEPLAKSVAAGVKYVRAQIATSAEKQAVEVQRERARLLEIDARDGGIGYRSQPIYTSQKGLARYTADVDAYEIEVRAAIAARDAERAEGLARMVPWDEAKKEVKSAWNGDFSAKDSAFFTDGRSMVVREAVTSKSERARLEKRSEGRYAAEGIPEESAHKVWDPALAEATEKGELLGVTGPIPGLVEMPVAVVQAGEREHYLDVGYLKRLEQAVKWDEIRVSPKTDKPVVLYRGGKPVAILMPVRGEDLYEARHPGKKAEAPAVETAKPKRKKAGSGSRGTVGFPGQAMPIGGLLSGQVASKKGAKAPRLSTLHRAFESVLRAAKSDTPIRLGRVKGQPLGWFRASTGVVRIRTYGNIATYAHELGHAFEAAIYGWPKGGPWKSPLVDKAMRAELLEGGKNLYPLPPVGGWKREGFAEFLRLYIQGEDTSGIQPKKTYQAQFPTFAKFWEQAFLPSQPAGVRAAFDRVRQLVAQWRDAGAKARIQAQVIDPGSIGERWKRIKKALGVDSILTELVEIARPLQLISNEVKKKHPALFNPKLDPYGNFKARRLIHSGMVADWISHGVTNANGERVSEPLAKVAELAGTGKQAAEDFGLYLYARRSVALWKDPHRKGRNPGISLQDAEQLIQELDTPQMAEAASIVYDWYDSAMDYAGELSPSFQDAIDKIRAVDPGDYVPLKRMFEDIDATALREQGTGSSSALRGTVSKRLRGSGRPIKDILPQLVSQAEELILRAHQRRVIDTLVEIAKLPQMGHVAEKVAKDQVPAAQTTVNELLSIINQRFVDAGLEPVGPGEGETMDLVQQAVTFFTPADSPKGVDPVIPIFEDGEMQWYRVPEAVYRSLAGMDVARLPVWFAPLIWQRRMKTLGTTGIRPAWAIFNIAKDLQTFLLNSRANGWAPRHLYHWFWAMGETFASAVTGEKYRSKWLDAYMRMGLTMEKSLTYDVNASKAEVRRLFQHGFMKVLDVRNVWDWIAGMIQFGETAPRLAELRMVAKDLGWAPGDPMDESTMIQLALAAKQVTIDFGEAGRLTRAYGRLVPFLTASIAGPRAALRGIQDHPGRYAAVGLMYSAAGLALWWRYKDEDWWKEMPADEKWRFLHFPSEDGDTMVRIPLAYDGPQAFYGMAVALADAAYQDSPEVVGEMLGQLAKTMAPPYLPPLAEEALEQAANKDFFFDSPIVPQSQEERPERQQYTAYTTKAAIVVAELAHKAGVEVSPARIDHAINGLFGGLPIDIMKETGLGPPEAVGRTGELSELPVIGRLWQRGGALGTRLKSVEEVYERRAEQTERQHDLEHKETDKEKTERLIIEDAAKGITIMGWIRAETPDADARFRLTREMMELARDALRLSKKSADPQLYQKRRNELEKQYDALEAKR